MIVTPAGKYINSSNPPIPPLLKGGHKFSPLILKGGEGGFKAFSCRGNIIRYGGVVIILLCLLFTHATASAAAASGPIHVIEVEGSINPGSAKYILQHIEQAEKDKAQCLIIRLDTPGGLETAMRSIVKGILNSPVPIVIYVSPAGARAASAGVVITVAAHIAAMAPGTNIGAAHPVNIGGKDIDKEMARKAENDMVAFARSIAEKRGRNAGWVEDAVRKSVSITETDALKLMVVDLIARDMDDLLIQLNGREVQTTIRLGASSTGMVKLDTSRARVVTFSEGISEKVLRLIGDPNIAYILMMIGLTGLYFELAHPGIIFPGVIGAISLILAFFAFQTLPVNYAGFLLILLSAVLFLLEIKIVSYGLLGLGGVIALVLGSMMLFPGGEPALRPAMKVLIPTIAAVSVFFIAVAFLAVRAVRAKPRTGTPALIGEAGVVKEWYNGRGKVFVHGEYWNARADEQMEAGTDVEVVSVDRFLLKVQKKR
ncbi:MAG: nodulation protein NfeD [Desulfovibrionales bacterium]|nr:nodulation protein NfeD [Desulfovibrionales bacterium]